MEKSYGRSPLLLRLVTPRKKYFVKTPWWVRKIYPRREWRVNTQEKILYLSFDDGPEPGVTPFILDQLRANDAKATFFCIGEQVMKYPDLYQRILEEGHQTGNHTQNHLNGWNTDTPGYLEDVKKAGRFIHSELFRPPYGRLRTSQAKALPKAFDGKIPRIIMWDVLSGDFDPVCTAETCIKNVTDNMRGGSIIVFHDNIRFKDKVKKALPEVLQIARERGFSFGII